MSITRFMHISDLHIAEKSNKYGLNDILKIFTKSTKEDKLGLYTSHDILKLESLVDILTKDTNYIDFIIITGDIATSASSKDLIFSSKLISNDVKLNPYEDIDYDIDFDVDISKITREEDLNLLKKVKVSLKKSIILSHSNIILLPGNHDRNYADESTLFTSFFYTNDDFSIHFNKYWNPKIKITNRIHTQLININNSEKKLIFIKIDCSLDKSIMPFTEVGTGEFSHEIQSDLENVLLNISNNENFENFIPIILIHYLPIESVNWSLALSRWDKLISLLHTYNIKHLFCGHTHFDKNYKVKGINLYCSSSTLSTKDNKSRVNIFQYDSLNDEIKIDKHYYWEKKFNKFELSI